VRSSTSPTSGGEGNDDAAPGTALQTQGQPGLGTVVSGGGLLDGKGALHVGMVFAVKWVGARCGGCGECRYAAAAAA
jgi:hypothetical protein